MNFCLDVQILGMSDSLDDQTYVPLKFMNAEEIITNRSTSFVLVEDFLRKWQQPVNNFYWKYRKNFNEEVTEYFQQNYP